MKSQEELNDEGAPGWGATVWPPEGRDADGEPLLEGFFGEYTTPPPMPTKPIYGGEGHGSADARQLVVIQALADRSALSFKERIIVLDSDVREAMAKARARLNVEAMKYSEQGFTWDLEDVHYDMGGRRIITATLRIARNGA